MTTPNDALHITTHGASELEELREPLLDIYAEVYADELDDPFSGLPRYWERLTAYATRTGFRIVIAHLDSEITGYALGYTLPETSRWWRGFLDEIDPTLLTETGSRTVAVAEIMIREPWRRQGIGRQLHDALLIDRTEERATLLVEADNIPAQSAYSAWGWRLLGRLKPFEDSPVFEAMVLDLRTHGTAN
ncbi:GNAT superfamily N-acetyltransferase [Allocatelliglobosispora scoriae]|uniref:GNAT superfamily N-acetyltransferase n=1 Tax=Allocatelliglobosispora scoriae TaxID=643052 RepID=A0A841C266_9ACTN|nr:GNAT family N-acetyltransferase [Allocatelliglobosispora scoriae]MBB5874015.1 GNAT superfamily N-acetyltransferase [Allocatelliglobosispora scoriae]